MWLVAAGGKVEGGVVVGVWLGGTRARLQERFHNILMAIACSIMQTRSTCVYGIMMMLLCTALENRACSCAWLCAWGFDDWVDDLMKTYHPCPVRGEWPVYDSRWTARL